MELVTLFFCPFLRVCYNKPHLLLPPASHEPPLTLPPPSLFIFFPSSRVLRPTFASFSFTVAGVLRNSLVLGPPSSDSFILLLYSIFPISISYILYICQISPTSAQVFTSSLPQNASSLYIPGEQYTSALPWLHLGFHLALLAHISDDNLLLLNYASATVTGLRRGFRAAGLISECCLGI